MISPILELYKGKLYLKFSSFFIKDCVDNFGTNIFSLKKSLTRTLTNLLSSWIFYLYTTYDYSGDYSLPNNYNNTESLRTTLIDLCKYDIKISDIDDKINKIINNLINNYKKILDILNEYEISDIYNKSIDNYEIIKKNIIIKKGDANLYFIKYYIKIPYFINNIKLKKILNNIIIPTKVYEKMVNNYTNNDNNIDKYIWSLIFRYQILGSNNNQLSILPNIINKMQKDYRLKFECFASGINFTCNNYCSIYYDIEKYFGSLGNFFNFNFNDGVYLCNPPFQKEVITLAINKILGLLEDDKQLTFIITIPIWDINGKTLMKNKYNNLLSYQNIDYGEFDIINKIKQSKYLKHLSMIPKENFTYVDHNFELYKNKTIQNTYIIILSNTLFDDNLLKFYNYN
jgi:hypothetical protein